MLAAGRWETLMCRFFTCSRSNGNLQSVVRSSSPNRLATIIYIVISLIVILNKITSMYGVSISIASLLDITTRTIIKLTHFLFAFPRNKKTIHFIYRSNAIYRTLIPVMIKDTDQSGHQKMKFPHHYHLLMNINICTVCNRLQKQHIKTINSSNSSKILNNKSVQCHLITPIYLSTPNYISMTLLPKVSFSR